MNHNYKLLTPGPLTTTDTVKREMLFDHCTWDDDYKTITQRIRAGLLELAHVSEPDYTAVLMQGSGTFGVESVLTSVVGSEDRLLICANGAYGLRMAEIARHAGLDHVLYRQEDSRQPDAAQVARLLREDPAITHVSMVPVSYTHLDVYKRQLINLQKRVELGLEHDRPPITYHYDALNTSNFTL